SRYLCLCGAKFRSLQRGLRVCSRREHGVADSRDGVAVGEVRRVVAVPRHDRAEELVRLNDIRFGVTDANTGDRERRHVAELRMVRPDDNPTKAVATLVVLTFEKPELAR